MNWLRRGFVWFLSVVLLVSLVGAVAAFDINRSLASPARLESWLAGSKIYDHVTASLLQQAEKSGSGSSDSGSVSLSDPVVQQAAQTVFSTSLVQHSINEIINNNYAWLTGKKPVPDFKIDLTSAKQAFATQVGQAAQAHLAAIPICSAQQLSQLTIPVDLLSVSCRPATLDPKAESDQVAQEINSNGSFLSSPVITAGSLNQGQFGQSSDDTSQGQPYYQKLSWAPKVYQIGLKLPWILSGLALLSALGIVLIALTRRRGIRRIGVVLLLAGLILIGLKSLADASVNEFSKLAVRGGLASELKQPISDFVRQLEPHLVRSYLWFGIAFAAVAVVIFILLFRSREGNSKPAGRRNKLPANTEPEVASADASSIRLAPRRSPPTSAPEIPGPDLNPPQPSSKPTPLGKNPPRPKPPRLIQ